MDTTGACAREYFHPLSVGKSEEIAGLFPVVSAFLSEKYSAGDIDGYNLLFLANAEQAADELVDDDWTALVPENYPLLYVFVQPNEHGDGAFDAFLREAGLVRVK
jgi:hypothetical protein